MTAIVDKLLTQASSMYVPEGYISEMILPEISVVQKTGKLGKYGTNHLRIESSLVGGRGAYKQVESITRSQSTYSVDTFGLRGLVTADDYRNVENPYNAELDESMGLQTLLWLRKEKSLADTLLSTSIITSNVTLSGTDQYDDYTASDPLGDFSTARATVRGNCGALANTAIMDWRTKNVLKFHPQLLDFLGFKESRPGGLSDDELSRALDVERVLVANAMYESAPEGQSSSLAAIWGKDILFCVAPVRAMVRQVSLGYRIQLAGMPPRRVLKYAENNPPGSTAIICDDSFDMFISNATAAYLIKAVVA